MQNNEEYSKSRNKEMIDKAVKEFLKKGGKVEKVRGGMGGDEYHGRDPNKESGVKKRFGR
jgi:hypothetical protein